MAEHPQREDNIEELVVDLKRGKRRVVAPAEPHLMIRGMLTVPCSCKRPAKTEVNKDIKPCRKNLLNSVCRWFIQRVAGGNHRYYYCVQPSRPSKHRKSDQESLSRQQSSRYSCGQGRWQPWSWKRKAFLHSPSSLIEMDGNDLRLLREPTHFITALQRSIQPPRHICNQVLYREGSSPAILTSNRSQLCHVLSRATSRKHVRSFRIQALYVCFL